MANGQLSGVLRRLGRLVGRKPAPEAEDTQLLQDFIDRRDAAAFEALVNRYGPLVLGVCRRVLSNEHAAEDAFQATFFVLARKATAIRNQSALGSWLCGTAYRIAMKARAAEHRRREQELQAGSAPRAEGDEEAAWDELRPILDEELNRLPEKYRAPLILCYLEGKTNEAAARELGWKAGSMSYRLAQARDRLRERLLNRGVPVASVMLGPLLMQKATVTVLAPLVQSTVHSALLFTAGKAVGMAGISVQAIALADAALHSMWLLKLKTAILAFLGVALIAGTTGWVLLPGRTVKQEDLDPRPRLSVLFNQSHGCPGFTCVDLRDPKNTNRPKRLCFDDRGLTNSIVVRIDGVDYVFGGTHPQMNWVRENGVLQREAANGPNAWKSVMEHENAHVRIMQTVELVRGEQTGLLDTALVRYQLWNRDTKPRQAGVRVMIDTFIGLNDGVPFLVPPTDKEKGYLMDSLKIFNGKDVPGFLRALESSDPNEPSSVVAEMGLRIKGAEMPDPVVICRWPDQEKERERWKWSYEPMNEPKEKDKDSCVVLYWREQTLKPGEKRELAFTYGLGRIATGTSEDSRWMRLLTAGSCKTGKTFTATVYVKGGGNPGDKVHLELPDGLSLAEGQEAEQKVPEQAAGQKYSQVSWRVRAGSVGKYTVKAKMQNGGTAKQEVQISNSSLFD